MSLTQDEYINTNTTEKQILHKEETTTLTINPSNPFSQLDYSVIIKAFEVEASNWTEEDYTKVSHYRDVYSTRNFSERTREQMDYYPGMHQTNNPPKEDPFYTNAKEMQEDRTAYWNSAMDNPNSFMNALGEKQGDFDYSKIFGSDTSAETKAKEIGKMLAQCVPCFDRLLDGAQLLPDADLLEIHMLNIKLRTDLLDKIMQLFNGGMDIDICSFLKMFSHLCPQDLLAILALLTQYLAKLNLDFRFNLDFIIQLVGPILSPFLDALSAWLDKWIQLIIAPIICVIDHINETILLAQSIQIPFSQVSTDLGMDLGVALPGHLNTSFTADSLGVGDTQGASTWNKWQWDAFQTPDSQKYNPSVPSFPTEETQLAWKEQQDGWTEDGRQRSEAERAERDAKWKEYREREATKRAYVPPPLRPEKSDGTRWSKDEIPMSEKYSAGQEFNAGYYPPEKQTTPKEGSEYFVTTPLVESIVEMRNILQGAIQYVKDWFTYITQMIYDLLGVDFGWMSKKTDNSMLKSKIIKIILLLKSLIETIAKNGLECGTDSNFDVNQLRFVLENELNKFSPTKYKVLNDGSIAVIPPNSAMSMEDIQQSLSELEDSQGMVPDTSIKTKPKPEQKLAETGIIIKDCFKNVRQDDLEKVRSWISDFERGIF